MITYNGIYSRVTGPFWIHSMGSIVRRRQAVTKPKERVAEYITNRRASRFRIYLAYHLSSPAGESTSGKDFCCSNAPGASEYEDHGSLKLRDIVVNSPTVAANWSQQAVHGDELNAALFGTCTRTQICYHLKKPRETGHVQPKGSTTMESEQDVSQFVLLKNFVWGKRKLVSGPLQKQIGAILSDHFVQL